MRAKSRRNFIQRGFAVAASLSLGPAAIGGSFSFDFSEHESKPWIELSKAAYRHNVLQISRMAGGKPIVAVLKNNAYGLGGVEIARILDDAPNIFGVAVVKDENALAMRAGGVTKPILLMGDFDSALFPKLIGGDITFSVHSKQALEKIKERSSEKNQPVNVALYIDTGLGRMGIPYRDTLAIAEQLQQMTNVQITQTFSTLTTPQDFAVEQIKRFNQLTRELEKKGIGVGLKHLAPSYSLLDLPSSHADAVRPGILLHGSFPLAKMTETETYPLKVTYRLKAPIIRLEKLKAGDTIGFSRFYPVKQDEWIATLPIGWADGYDSGAENGAKVLLADRLYPVVNVNASHTNISLGPMTDLKVGDVATLIGPDRPEITPEGFGQLVKGHNYLQINYKESITKYVYEAF